MRVALIYVRDLFTFPTEKRSRRGVPQVIGYPPLGIMSLSAVLKRAGHECLMFDQANPETPTAVILDEIRRHQPDLVGLSFLSTSTYPYAKTLARQIRAADERVRIAFGGVFATVNDDRVKERCPEVDFVCRGDGEQLILDLLERMDDPDTVPGLTWAERDGTVRRNPARPPDRDLDQWPFPDRESLPLDFLESMPVGVPAVLSNERFTAMQSSRGCVAPCVFCDIPGFAQGKIRARSAENVVAELKQLQEDGYGAVSFTDDQFLFRPKRIEAICRGISENGIDLRWTCEGRVDSKCTDLFPMMADAGCRSLAFGVESGSQRILERLGKNQTLEQIETAVTKAKKARIEVVHGFFMIGCPDETPEDIDRTFRFASRLPIDSLGVNRMCVFRGTPLWREYVERGLVDDETDWHKSLECSEIDPTVLSPQEIQRLRAKGMRRLITFRLLRRPLQTLRLLRRLARNMRLRDVLYLLVKPFLPRRDSHALGGPHSHGRRSGARAARRDPVAISHRCPFTVPSEIRAIPAPATAGPGPRARPRRAGARGPAERLADLRVRDSQDLRRRQRCVDRSRLSHRQRRHRDAGRHLDHRQQGVEAEELGLHGDREDRAQGLGGHDSRQVCGAAGGGDEDLHAGSLTLFEPALESFRSAVGGENANIVGDLEALQRRHGVLHDAPIGA